MREFFEVELVEFKLAEFCKLADLFWYGAELVVADVQVLQFFEAADREWKGFDQVIPHIQHLKVLEDSYLFNVYDFVATEDQLAEIGKVGANIIDIGKLIVWQF